MPITAALALRLKQAARRSPHAPLLLRTDGTPWGNDPSNNYQNDMCEIIAAAGLDPVVTMYALRHSSIVRGLLAGVPTRVVASTHDTSVAMIERHYPSTSPTMRTRSSRRALLQDAPMGDNVIPIAGHAAPAASAPGWLIATSAARCVGALFCRPVCISHVCHAWRRPADPAMRAEPCQRLRVDASLWPPALPSTVYVALFAARHFQIVPCWDEPLINTKPATYALTHAEDACR